ncbi:MAG TPA: hypothetical protein VEK55_01590 [Xanthobacteraceae bacterium]|nr:hypothetical protein [Xanthobacteraceae bacterium]
MRRALTRRWAYTMGAVMGLFLVTGHGTAIAQENDDDDTFEQKIIKGVLGGIGLDVGNPGIDYSARAPLVIPPNTDLPPPETAAATPPAWPKEARRKKPTSSKKLDPNGSVRQADMERATASAAEMTSGPKPAAGASGTPPPPADPVDNTSDVGGRPLPASVVDKIGLFNIFGNKAEQAQFVHEPPRVNLTQPPTGYQTPSPNYPYGIAQVKKGPTTQEMGQTTDHAATDVSSGTK